MIKLLNMFVLGAHYHAGYCRVLSFWLTMLARQLNVKEITVRKFHMQGDVKQAYHGL